MADPSIIRPTAFPRLDDLLFSVQREDNDEVQYKQRDFSFATNHIPRPRGRDALLKDYSQFIAFYTGEREVAYRYALRKQLHHAVEPQIIQARAMDTEVLSDCKTNYDYTLDIIHPGEGDTTSFDFGFEIVADVDNFTSTEAPPLLHCPFVIQYHAMEMTLTLRYDALRMDEEYADAAFKTLVNYMSRRQVYAPQETRLSILNHSALQPSLLYSKEAEVSLLYSGFRKTVNEYPNRRALDYRSETTQFTMTYRQLNGITTALAHKLLSSIPQTSHSTRTIVPVYMDASPALYVSWLAVLKAGFAFCPLPVGTPALELQSIVEDACASIVLTDGPMLCGCPWDAWYRDDDDLSIYLDVNEFITTWMQTPETFNVKPLPCVAKTDLAYVIYSSKNSSAMPIGTEMTHRAAFTSITSYSKQIPSCMSKKEFSWLTSASPVSHTSVLEVFTTWSTGGTLCAVSPTLDLTTAVNKVSATITTASFSQASTLNLARVPSLRHLWCVGALPLSLVQQLQNVSRSIYSPLTVLRLYTAATDSILTGIISPASCSTRDSIIGSPLPETSVLFLHSAARAAVPLGAVGDLYVSGVGLPSGYLNRPDLDAAAFLVHPVYGRLYKTGDRGRLVKNGSGELIVDLVKSIGDPDVEVEEIESVYGRDSVASMVDSFTETSVLESEEKLDVTEANVLSLIGKTLI